MSTQNHSRKIALTIIGILLVVIAFWLSKKIVKANEKPPKKTELVKKKVPISVVNNKTITSVISANGILVAQKRLELFSEVQGVFLLRKKLFRSGQKYTKGETLLAVDASEYRANVKSQKSVLYNQIASIMPDLRLDYPDAFPKWQQYLDGFHIDKPISKLPEITSEKVKYFLAARNIISTYYTIKNLESRLAKYSITAPFSGIVTEALVTEGSLIRPGQKLGSFIKTGVYELAVSISKEYATLLQVGKKVTLKTASSNTIYMGKIVRVGGNINQNSQTLDCFIEVADPALKEGMYLEAKIEAQQIENAVEVDRSLLQNKEQLFVVKDSVLDLVTVKPVYISDDTAIVKGLTNGTKIVSKPILGAYQGMIVEIESKETE